MLFLGAVLAIGLLVGWVLGGRLRNLGQVRIQLWGLAPVALLLQVVPLPDLEGEIGELLPAGVLVISYLMLIMVAAVNWYHRGLILLLIGFVMNLLVISANRGMPVSVDSLERIGGPGSVEQLRDAPRGAKHHLARDDDVLLPLADVIGVGPPFDVVVSLGDIFAYSGGAVFLATAMRRRPRRDLGLEERPSQPAMWS